MENKPYTLGIDDLRENIVKPEKIIFHKNVVGGYDPKEVSEHIRFMNERLYHAEAAFKSQLEEYNSMTTMYSQEREKLTEQLRQAQADQADLASKVEALQKEKQKLEQENSRYLETATAYNACVQENTELHADLDELNKLCDEYEAKEAKLTAENTRLQATAKQLQAEMQGRVSLADKDAYERALSDLAVVRKQYDALMTEKNIVISEKNAVLEQSRIATENLEKMYQKNRELWDENTRLKLQTRKLISVFEARSHEASHRYMRNIDGIREHIKGILDILDNEGVNITKLVHSPYEDMDIKLGTETEKKI